MSEMSMVRGFALIMHCFLCVYLDLACSIITATRGSSDDRAQTQTSFSQPSTASSPKSQSLAGQTHHEELDKLLQRGHQFLAVGAPEAALEIFKEAQDQDPYSEKAREGVATSSRLSNILSDAITAGEEHPVNFGQVRYVTALLHK